jgi:curved DNA-binding protein CbpA
MRTHYEVLGVGAGASSREINAAYRKHAKKFHPDVGGDAAKFQKITDAYNALRNRAEREAYDFENRFETFVDATVRRQSTKQKILGYLRRRAFWLLSTLFFLAGVLFIDAGDGIHEELNPYLLGAGSGAILLSVGFFANRDRQFRGGGEALFRAVASISLFLLDVALKFYLIFVVIFLAVALVALLNWLKVGYLHFLPANF